MEPNPHCHPASPRERKRQAVRKPLSLKTLPTFSRFPTPAMAAPPNENASNGSAAPEAEAKPETQASEATAAAEEAPAEGKRWPGWPGDSVFRLIVPVAKVGSIIGRKGELIKKICEETRARVRVLDGPIGTTDRIVLVSGREESEAEVSPAMDAVLRVFKRVNGMQESGDGTTPASTAPAVCSVRLLVASSQAINLIGKQGVLIKSIQESTGATIRVLTGDELPFYATADERVVDIQGESLKVLSALEAVVGHLRKFLVDHSVLPLFEKNLNTQAPQEHSADPWGEKTQSSIHTAQQTTIGNDYPLPSKRDSLYADRETQLDSQRSGLSLYGADPASGLRTAGIGRATALVTQITQTMQIPLSYAEDIIGVGGRNIGYIRHSSGAVVTIHETRGIPDEITVEIKGNTSQVHTAQQLIEDFVNKGQVGGSYIGAEPSLRSSYMGGAEPGLRSSYLGGSEPSLRSSYLGGTTYPSSSLADPPHGGYGSSGLGGYGGYRY